MCRFKVMWKPQFPHWSGSVGQQLTMNGTAEKSAVMAAGRPAHSLPNLTEQTLANIRARIEPRSDAARQLDTTNDGLAKLNRRIARIERAEWKLVQIKALMKSIYPPPILGE